MATLKTRVRGEEVRVELTVEELHRLLEFQRLSYPRGRGKGFRGVGEEGTPVARSELGTAARATADLARAIKDAWPEGVDLVENPELTTGNVRRFLIRKVLKGELTVSTGEVSLQFFKRRLSPSRPQDAADLRRLWYCIREAKRDVEEAVGGHWEDATDAPMRAGSSRAWRLVPSSPVDSQLLMAAYRESR